MAFLGLHFKGGFFNLTVFWCEHRGTDLQCQARINAYLLGGVLFYVSINRYCVTGVAHICHAGCVINLKQPYRRTNLWCAVNSKGNVLNLREAT